MRALAFSALRAGFQPWAIDLFADRDLAEICPTVKIKRYPEDFAAALAKAPESRWMYTGGLENYPRLIDEMAKIRPLVGNTGAVVRSVRGARRFGEVVREAGFNFPEIRRAVDEGTCEEQWLVKAPRSSGGLGVSFARAEQMRRVPRGCYLQRYIEGEAVSAVFVGAGGGAALVGVTKQWAGRDFGLAREFLYVGNVGPLVLDADEVERLGVLGEALVKEFGLVGLFNVDFVRNVEGMWPVEINPRHSASVEVLERGLGVSAVRLHVEACGGGVVPTTAAEGIRTYCAKAVVYADRDGVVPAQLETIAQEWNRVEGRPGLADLPRTGDAIEAGQPVVTVIFEGATMDQVERELRRRVAMICEMLRT